MPRADGTVTGSVPTINGRNGFDLKIRLGERVRSQATKIKLKK